MAGPNAFFRMTHPLLRFLLIALLVLLPLRMAWSAAAGYCAHEPAPMATAHFGHHAPTQDAAPQEGAGPAEAEAAAAQPVAADCGTCHAGAGQLPEPVPPPLNALGPQALAPAPHRVPASQHLPDIERPKWPDAA